MSQIFSLLLIATAAWTSASGLPESTLASNEEFIRGTWRIDGYLDQKNRRLDIVVDRQKGQLKIGGNGPFLPVKPKG